MIEPLRTVTATRYAAALREGGSLPRLMEADDGLWPLPEYSEVLFIK